MFEKVGGIVGVGNEDGIGEENDGKEVKVSMRVVLMVEDRTNVIEIEDGSTEDVP